MPKWIGVRYNFATKTWHDHKGKPMEWHYNDPMRFRDVVVWYMCMSPHKRIADKGRKIWYKEMF